MSSTKTSSEGQMGSGESDDEFYNVKMSNAGSEKSKEKKNESTDKIYSPQRTKVKYDYKFESSSDDDSVDGTSEKVSKSESTRASPNSQSISEEKKEEDSNDKTKLSQNTSKVVEKINEELKSMKNVASTGKVKGDKTEITVATSPKHIPTTVGVTPPMVVVPSPMIVPQSHSVMAMGSTGMLVPPAIGIANQNVMIQQANMLNLSGNVMRGANAVTGIVSTPMGIANPSLINQGNLVGMANDILQLQGNIMGISAPGNMMQIPAGLCMAGNMIPVQSNLAALQGNLMGIQGTAGNLMTNQTILNNQGSIITNAGGVMMNPANVMTVNTLMNNQGTLLGNPGNLMLNMNSLVGSQSGRMNYPGGMLSGVNSVRNQVNVSSEINKSQINYVESQGKSSESNWKGTKSQSISSDKLNFTSSKSPSPSDSGDGNEDEEDEEDDGSSYGNSTGNVRETTNTFKNDGSFMEMFKKMSEANNTKGSSNADESSSTEVVESETTNLKKPPVMLSGIVGKRRGGRVLKTGLVKKVKKESEVEEEKGPKDAWAMYMAEVKKYREASCEEEGKTRPLVK